MPYNRRFSSSKPRYGNRGFRSPRRFTPRTRSITRPQQWNMGPFFIDEETTLANSSGVSTDIYTHLASIAISLSNAGAGDDLRTVGNMMGAMQRSIMIGGIVADWGIEFPGGVQGDAGDGNMWCTNHLLVDRLFNNTGTSISAPASLGAYDPYRSLPPTGGLNTSLSANADDNTLPTRILWTRTQYFNLQAAQVEGQIEGALHYPEAVQRLLIRAGTLNKRLRVRLNDEQGLFWTWQFRNGAGFNVSSATVRTVRRWMRGHIYYRYVQ